MNSDKGKMLIAIVASVLISVSLIAISACSFSESQRDKAAYVIDPCLGVPEDQVVECLKAQVEELYAEVIWELEDELYNDLAEEIEDNP